jgi:hypothetical protein
MLVTIDLTVEDLELLRNLSIRLFRGSDQFLASLSLQSRIQGALAVALESAAGQPVGGLPPQQRLGPIGGRLGRGRWSRFFPLEEETDFFAPEPAPVAGPDGSYTGVLDEPYPTAPPAQVVGPERDLDLSEGGES